MSSLAVMDIIGIALLAAGAFLAFASGFFLWKAVDELIRAKSQRASVLPVDAGTSADGSEAGIASLDGRVLGYAQMLSRAIVMGKCRAAAPGFLVRMTARRFEAESRLAGLGDRVSVEGLCEAQMRLMFAGALAGLIIGFSISAPLAATLVIVGAMFGFTLPKRALKHRTAERANEVERHLPEMLDVVALGMRSGMSFDSSLLLYEQHFTTMLSRELANFQRQWSSGLLLREDALRKVASTYDSVILSRVMETVVRSVRYGSSMVESLETDAAEARAVYQSRREERVAKAPVKMMIPTGVLILPAMLIMVLGPVLLELAGGGL